MTSKLLTHAIAFAVVASLTLFSCTNEDDVPVNDHPGDYRGVETVLGRKLKNPYTVEQMAEAVESIRAKDSSFPQLEIKTTHYYIRFKPSDYQQYDRLVSDTSVYFQDHPFDFEVLTAGEFYHEASLPDTVPTFQYASVPVTYNIPEGIAYDILDELYLPENDEQFSQSDRLDTDVEQLFGKLEHEALLLSDNLDDESGQQDNISARTSGWLPDKWYPEGRIMVYDDRVRDHIPMEGVKVQARRWFKNRYAVTDRFGFFHFDDGFRYEVNYSIPWERAKFDIRSGTFGQARFNGPKKKGNWLLRIERGGMSFHYAHVFRAALRYYYNDIGGLKRPGFRLKYSVFDKQGEHFARNIGNWSLFGANPNILIYRYDPSDGSENDSDEMFSTTCHETAHSTHMEVMNAGLIQFLQVSEKIRESWAIAVEWSITQKEYKRMGISNYAEANYAVEVNYPIPHAFQYWAKDRMPNLTSLFIDIVDTNNQKGQVYSNNKRGTINDPVGGYTLSSIEALMLKKVYGMSSLSDELKAHRPGEVTQAQIDVLLENF
jgi:hypothetical protein